MVSKRSFFTLAIAAAWLSPDAWAECPAGTTPGQEIFCIYDNGDDGGQFQVCNRNGSPVCAFGIAFPGTPQVPEPFHGCEAPFQSIEYCQFADLPDDTPPDDPEEPIDDPDGGDGEEEFFGCELGFYVQSLNDSGSLADQDGEVIKLLKKYTAAVSQIWVKSKQETAADAAIYKKAVTAASKIVLKGSEPLGLDDVVSAFSLEAIGELKKCSEETKKFVKQVGKKAATIGAALEGHGLECNTTALAELSKAVCKTAKRK